MGEFTSGGFPLPSAVRPKVRWGMHSAQVLVLHNTHKAVPPILRWVYEDMITLSSKRHAPLWIVDDLPTIDNYDGYDMGSYSQKDDGPPLLRAPPFGEGVVIGMTI
jgi:hypothetical protein